MSPLDTTRALGRWAASAAERPPARRYLVAVVLPLIAAAFSAVVLFEGTAPYFPLFSLAVIGSAMYGGVLPGITTTMLSAALNMFLATPQFSFQVDSREDALRIALFVVAGLAISFVLGAVGELQRRLSAERQRLHVTLNSIGDAVIATDEEGKITFLNPMAECATGWRTKEALGQPLETVFHIVNEITRAAAHNPARKVLDSGAIVGLANHTILIRKDGSELAIDDSAAPIRSGNQVVGVVLVFRDITEKRHAERALLESQKLASVGRLAATIAHEINNPLECITNLLYLIQTAPDLPPIAAGYTDMAQQQLMRAAHITRQTLAFARRSDERQHCLLREAAEEIIELYKGPLQEKQIAVLRKYGEGAHPVYASRSELRQLLGNLIANAIDALPREGRIYIRLRRVNNNGEAQVRLSVADSGPGIPAMSMGRIFEAFFTTKRDAGTGLGLWVSKTIVESHGGRIRARSRVGKGTVFSVVFPAAAERAARPPWVQVAKKGS